MSTIKEKVRGALQRATKAISIPLPKGLQDKYFDQPAIKKYVPDPRSRTPTFEKKDLSSVKIPYGNKGTTTPRGASFSQPNDDNFDPGPDEDLTSFGPQEISDASTTTDYFEDGEPTDYETVKKKHSKK